MAERMTEEKVAELEAVFRKRERANENARADRSALASSSSAFRIAAMTSTTGGDVAAAEREWLAAKAQLDRQQREDADAVTRQMLAANQAMAEASKAAAKYSADAARAAKLAAWGTLIAAVIAATSVAIQAWQAWHTGRQPASPPPATQNAKP